MPREYEVRERIPVPYENYFNVPLDPHVEVILASALLHRSGPSPHGSTLDVPIGLPSINN